MKGTIARKFAVSVLFLFIFECMRKEYIIQDYKYDPAREVRIETKVFFYSVFWLIPQRNFFQTDFCPVEKKIVRIIAYDSLLDGAVCGLTLGLICPHTFGAICQ